MKRHAGPTYYGHPYLDGRGGGFARHQLEPSPRGDADLMRSSPPRTKQSDPYCYDPFTIWGRPFPDAACNGSNYTDRLDHGDRAKYEQLAKQHYLSGTSAYVRPFDSQDCKGNLIEAFLRDWHADPELKLLRVIEYCQPYSGFPTWRLDYVTTKKVAT